MRGKDNEGKIPLSTARGVIALIVLLFVFQVVTFALHKCSGTRNYKGKVGEAENQTTMGGSDSLSRGAEVNQILNGTNEGNLTGRTVEISVQAQKVSERPQRFKFDPNTISLDSLMLLGLSYRQALTVIHYREKGGRFLQKKDFAKIYTLPPELFAELEPYICVLISDKKERGGGGGGVGREANLSSINNQLSNREIESYNHTTQDRASLPIDLNEADSIALVSIRGIGGYYAHQILLLRSQLGSFASVDQLLEIRTMTQERLEPLRKYLFVHPDGIKKFSLADADYDFLRRHPYVGVYAARGIELFRESAGRDSCTLGALVRNGILSEESAERLRPYVEP